MIVLQSHTAAVWEAVMSRQKTCPKMCKTRPKGRLSAEPREEQNPQAGLQQRAFVMGSPTAQGLETFFPAQGTLTWFTPSVTWSRRGSARGHTGISVPYVWMMSPTSTHVLWRLPCALQAEPLRRFGETKASYLGRGQEYSFSCIFWCKYVPFIWCIPTATQN